MDARSSEGFHAHPFGKLRTGSNLPPIKGEGAFFLVFRTVGNEVLVLVELFH